MDIYEEAVMNYILSSEKYTRFLNWQYKIKYDADKKIGGSLPDFVVLDFTMKKIYVIEVTTAWDVDSLLSRVKEKDSRWIEPLKCNEFLPKWPFHVTVFIREERVDYFKKKIASIADVSVIPLSKVDNFLGNRNFDFECPLED